MCGKSYFSTPDHHFNIKSKMSGTNQAIYDLIYIFFCENKTNRATLSIKDIAVYLEKTEVSIRNGIRELKAKELFFIEELEDKLFFVMVRDEELEQEFNNELQKMYSIPEKPKRLIDRSISKNIRPIGEIK